MIQGHVLFSFRCRGGIAGDRAGEMKSEGGAVLAVDRRVGAPPFLNSGLWEKYILSGAGTGIRPVPLCLLL